jgi:hypothetical protein
MTQFRVYRAIATTRRLSMAAAGMSTAIVLALFGGGVSLALAQTQNKSPPAVEKSRPRPAASSDVFSDRNRSGPRCSVPGPCGRCDCPAPRSDQGSNASK